MTSAFNSTGFSYLSALRLLASRGAMTAPDLAKADSRVTSNIRRDAPKLAEAGLVTFGGDQLSLTDTGRQWVHGQDIAEGLVPLPSGSSATPVSGTISRWPMDAIRPNPLNRRVTDEGIEDLADSIIGAGDILEPLILSPADANGVRTIIAGERRWTAAQLIDRRDIEEHNENVLDGEPVALLPHLPAVLREGLPFIEREADDTQTLVITLIENSQRKDLTPLEDALQLQKLADATGWNATELARKIGRTGRERDVQVKLKIAREATPEAIAEYEANGSWDRLRDSVTKAKGPDTVHLALFIIEIAMRAEQETDSYMGDIHIAPDLEWPQSWAKWFEYDPASGRLCISKHAHAWAEEDGLIEAPSRTLQRHRAACGRPAMAPTLRPFATECLNWRPEAAQTPQEPETADLPLTVADAATVAPADDGAAIPEDLLPAWRELLHKIANDPAGENATAIGQFWLCPKATRLQQGQLVTMTPRPGLSAVATLTPEGVAVRDRFLALWGETLETINWAEPISTIRLPTEPDFDGTNYLTPWLAHIPQAAPVPTAPAEIQTDLEEAAASTEPLPGANGWEARKSTLGHKVICLSTAVTLCRIDPAEMMDEAERANWAQRIADLLNAAQEAKA